MWTINPVSPEVALEFEGLGYRAVGVSSAAPDDLSWVDPIFDQTDTLWAATGIVNICTSAAAPVAEAFHRLEHHHPGRFVLDVGAGHREAITQWGKALRRAQCLPRRPAPLLRGHTATECVAASRTTEGPVPHLLPTRPLRQGVQQSVSDVA